MPDLTFVVPYTKFLHVAAIFTAVTLVVGGDLYFMRVASSGSAEATARLGHAIRRRGPITGPIIEIAVVFGFVTALLGGFDLLAPWLVGAYVVVVAMTIFAFRVAAPEFSAILQFAEAGDDAGVGALMATGRYRRVAMFNGALFAIAIYLMVVKPTW